ncbi:hypothetical protein BdWA1_001829 [Babesia duncani]|uniref:Uncharacterized protein n=1 Tax=Babesia duncani TaxID=323732 RepID=A0AAD9PKL0_9APIC|nr:hypothetical protein BdWA1_001829 [Babesia duncani]
MSKTTPSIGVVNYVVVGHNILVLCFWLFAEFQIILHISKHFQSGTNSDINQISADGLWNYIKPALQIGNVLHSLNIVYTVLEGAYSKSQLFVALYQILEGYLLFFVALPLLNGQLNIRNVVTSSAIWILVKIFQCLNIINLKRGIVNEFLEWSYNKCK